MGPADLDCPGGASSGRARAPVCSRAVSARCSPPAEEAGGTTGTAGTTAIPLPRPNHPVTWPIFKDNQPIKAGLQPEQGATLKLYNWVAYINPQCLKDFGKKYNCKVTVTTFNTMNEAMSKLRSGQVNFDVFFPTVDRMGQLVEAKLIQPINHSYIPNISQTWPDFTSPFYDGKWRYTVPYTIYTTGIAWRKDKVPENPYTMANPWAMPWQAKYKNKVAILDDYRESISLGADEGRDLQPQHHQPGADHRGRQVPAAAVGHDERPHRQQRLHRGPQRPDLDPPRLVRRHGRRPLLPAQGRLAQRPRLLVPAGRQGPGRRTTPSPSSRARRTRCSRTCS